MMTNDDQLALSALRMVAHLRARFAEFRKILVQQAAPLSAVFEVECNEYERTFDYPGSYGLLLEAYVDAEFPDGRAVLWSVTITHDGDSWHIDPGVSWHGRDAIVSLEERIVPHIQDLLGVLPVVLDELFGTLKDVAPLLQAEAAAR